MLIRVVVEGVAFYFSVGVGSSPLHESKKEEERKKMEISGGQQPIGVNRACTASRCDQLTAGPETEEGREPDVSLRTRCPVCWIDVHTHAGRSGS